MAQVAYNVKNNFISFFLLSHLTLLVPLLPITDNLVFLLKQVVPLVPILGEFHRGLETVI